MNICQAYCSHDISQSIRWQEQIKQWGGLGHHKLFLLRAFNCEPIPEILPFTALTDYAKVTSDWRAGAGNQTNCASGPDSMWRMFARYFHSNHLGPWFNCEADCIPLFRDSLDRWEAEYLQAGKDFMGGFVDFPVPHLTGCSQYPENSATYPDLILPHRTHDRKREISFDVAGGNVTLPNAHLTKSMQHCWRAPPFTSQEDFDSRVSKDALFYHACKDGSIFKYLGGGGIEIPSAVDMGQSIERCPPSNTLDAPASVPEQSGNGVAPPLINADASNSLEVQRARAANARAALAAKRATGWKPKKRRKQKARNIK